MMRAWSKIRGWLVVGVWGAALGVVTTYGVGWGLMNVSSLGWWSGAASAGSNFECVSSLGWTVAPVTRRGASLIAAVGQDGTVVITSDTVLIPAWSLTKRLSPNELYPGWNSTNLARCMFWERAAGWPMLAVVEREVASPPGVWPTRVIGVAVRVGGNGEAWSGVTFAFTPIWSGFVVDAAV